MIRALPLLLLVACAAPRPAARPVFSGPPKAYKLLAAVEPAETAERKERRNDLYAKTDTGEPVPAVIGGGQVGPVARHGAKVSLYGDEAAKEGWSVDNFVLLEFSNAAGKVFHRLAVGFHHGVAMGAEEIDSAGPMQFAFGPGEIDLTRFLPVDEPFTVKATALDVGGVGRVSDVFLVLSADASAAAVEEDLKDK